MSTWIYCLGVRLCNNLYIFKEKNGIPVILQSPSSRLGHRNTPCIHLQAIPSTMVLPHCWCGCMYRANGPGELPPVVYPKIHRGLLSSVWQSSPRMGSLTPEQWLWIWTHLLVLWLLTMLCFLIHSYTFLYGSEALRKFTLVPHLHPTQCTCSLHFGRKIPCWPHQHSHWNTCRYARTKSMLPVVCIYNNILYTDKAN